MTKKRKKFLNSKIDTEKYKEFLIKQGDIFSKELREKATEWEKIFFRILKDLHYKFKFQQPVVVPVGKSYKLYIVDFLLENSPIFIECDGGFHSSSENKKKDNLRTKHLSKMGLFPIRLTNKQISTYSKEQINQIIKQKIEMLKNH